MEILQALKTAIEFETRVREVYVEALDETTSKVGTRVFKLLADEEDRHLTYLKKKLNIWQESGELEPEELKTDVPDFKRIAEEVAKLEAAIDKDDQSKELKILEKARDVETETSSFYRRLVKELPPHGIRFFESFVKIEEGHLALVEAEINALKGMGFWFDMPEFDLEAD